MATKRVLVVDDEPDIRMIVGLNLGLAEVDFEEAEDGTIAIAMLESARYDGLILDLAMPHVDGYGVLESIGQNESLKGLAIMVLSARSTPQAAIKALELGAHIHLIKPFSPAAVAAVMLDLIASSPEEREARRLDGIRRAGELERLGVNTV